MTELNGLRVIVAGAGAVGSCVALELADRGAAVTLADPAPLGLNASGVAAGMLAPAMESALDPHSAGRFPLLEAGRDRWPAFAERHGLGVQLHREGALWVGDASEAASLLKALRQAGAAAETVDAATVETLSPGALAREAAVFTPEDWRLEPERALRELRRAFLARGGRYRASTVTGWTAGRAQLGPGSVEADLLVIATGLPAAGFRLPQQRLLQPIKGQIARFPGARPTAGPTLRTSEVYLVPSAGGVVAGASMEFGRSNAEVDPGMVATLQAAAARLAPWLSSGRALGAAGVRAGTADGLPLVGWSGEPGLLLALGARRNGWLLAPMLAESLADLLAGERGSWADDFAPDRPLAAFTGA